MVEFRKDHRTGKVHPLNPRFFIMQAIREPGAFRRYVENTYGSRGFDSEGRIKSDVVRRIAFGHCPVCLQGVCTCPTGTTRRRARLAVTLAKIREGR